MPLRRATLDDLDVLVEHRRAMFEAFGEGDADALAAHDRAYRRWARQRMRTGRLAAWIVEHRGAPVASGAVWLQPVQPRPGGPETRPYLLSMFTDPAHRGRGHARRIVQAAIAWCRAEGYDRLHLHASEAGRRVYEALGFAATTEMRLRW